MHTEDGAPFGLVVLFLVFVGLTFVLPVLRSTIATVGLTTAEGVAAGFISTTVVVVIFLFSTGPLRT